VVAAKSLLAGLALALVAATSALADDPTVRISQADQKRAEAALLRLADFGVGWTGGRKNPEKLTAPNCPGFNPKESDLVVTGHAEARFTYARAGIFVALAQDTQVLASREAVATDFARTVRPRLADCLAHQLKSSGKQVMAVTVSKLALGRIGSVSAAYRAVVTLRINGRVGKLVRDFIFFGQGRYEYSLVVDAPLAQGAQLASFETTIAQMLVRRSSAGVA
jgi:hypothetical protein